MDQSDVFRYAVAGFMAAILFGSCAMVLVAAWLDEKQES
jgi:hypothetical protein